MNYRAIETTQRRKTLRLTEGSVGLRELRTRYPELARAARRRAFLSKGSPLRPDASRLLNPGVRTLFQRATAHPESERAIEAWRRVYSWRMKTAAERSVYAWMVSAAEWMGLLYTKVGAAILDRAARTIEGAAP